MSRSFAYPAQTPDVACLRSSAGSEEAAGEVEDVIVAGMEGPEGSSFMSGSEFGFGEANSLLPAACSIFEGAGGMDEAGETFDVTATNEGEDQNGDNQAQSNRKNDRATTVLRRRFVNNRSVIVRFEDVGNNAETTIFDEGD